MVELCHNYVFFIIILGSTTLFHGLKFNYYYIIVYVHRRGPIVRVKLKYYEILRPFYVPYVYNKKIDHVSTGDHYHHDTKQA